MRAAVNLHINITDDMRGGVGGGGGGMPGYAMTRTPSNSSVNSTSSNPPPLTPINQTIGTPTINRQFMFHRLNSVSSIATSEDDSDVNARLDNPLDSFLDWPSQDDDLLMNIYQAYIDNPTTAPFAGKIPPSGVVHQVAKTTLHEAKKKSRPFLHSMLAVRKRLLLLCERNSAPTQIYTRASSTSSLSSNSSFNFSNAPAITPGTIPPNRFFRQLSFGSNGSPESPVMTPLANRIKRPCTGFANGTSPGEAHAITTNDGVSLSAFMLGHPDDYDEEMAFADESPLGTSLLPPPPTFRIPEYENSNNNNSNNNAGPQSPIDIQPSPFDRKTRQGSTSSRGSPKLGSQSQNVPPQQPNAYSSQTQQNIANWLLNTPNHHGQATTSGLGMPLTPAPSPLNIKNAHRASVGTSAQANPDDFDFGLDSPFKEMTVTPTRPHQQSPGSQPSTPVEDPYPNYTAQRKRESLRMKRGMKAPI
ncbi:hypothetical protein AWJ20_2050 [Sugiyamaella lignohabitans]|uniref:Uncharacterized protein n=1 Tax=Sugiyamaella lignohabitans TaxID=796027 RepID=A0A161HFS5_9ASCO|nr:uncharacterized protein AWJ20_2050 [Sugiyamaella lignohabitans]ANB14460.1 hypothetical protein AWJ20_2050 [Sugiyamaella lignohabitans]